MDERGVHLQFNLSHTGSLLGAPNFHHERRLLHCRASKKTWIQHEPARTNMPETAYKRGLTGQGMREANLQTFQYIARHSAAHHVGGVAMTQEFLFKLDSGNTALAHVHRVCGDGGDARGPGCGGERPQHQTGRPAAPGAAQVLTRGDSQPGGCVMQGALHACPKPDLRCMLQA